MSPILIAGTTIVNLALISYTVFIIKQRKAKTLTKSVLFFLSMGVVFDISATIFMITGSSTGGISLHGLIGYSSLTGMLLEVYFSYKVKLKQGINATLSPKFIRISTIVYAYWVLAYITGAAIVAFRHAS